MSKVPFILFLFAVLNIVSIKCFTLTKLLSLSSKERVSCKESKGNLRIAATRLQSSTSTSTEQNIPTSTIIQNANYPIIIPFLSEHIQLSDQLLFVGASTNLALLLSKNGYGTKKTGFITCIDEDPVKIQECVRIANEDETLKANMNKKKLIFKVESLSNMPEICKQSVYDSIVDYAGIDSLHHPTTSSCTTTTPTTSTADVGIEPILNCIDHLQNSLRLGNILVCLSYLDKKQFCKPFEQRFGWVQELDGK